MCNMLFEASEVISCKVCEEMFMTAWDNEQLQH